MEGARCVMVEHRTTNREDLGSTPTDDTVSCHRARHINYRLVDFKPSMRWLRPDMTDKILPEALTLNTNKTKMSGKKRLGQTVLDTFSLEKSISSTKTEAFKRMFYADILTMTRRKILYSKN